MATRFERVSLELVETAQLYRTLNLITAGLDPFLIDLVPPVPTSCQQLAGWHFLTASQVCTLHIKVSLDSENLAHANKAPTPVITQGRSL